MRKMHELDPEGANLAAGVKTAFAVVFVGTLVALALGLAPALPDETAPAAPAAPSAPAAAAPAEAGTVHFPSQYTLDAGAPVEHVQAF
ncbi:MAG TPA: hypothetical protein VFX05_10010 [Casimicrobiaceae bacterium]|nr:hypothetical protein [Casimicrobiaceae bacterium]